MATKKIKLLAFTALTAIGVLANDFSHISAPTLTAVQDAHITDGEITFARGETEKTGYIPAAVPPLVAVAAQPKTADTTVTLVESEAPAIKEDAVEVAAEAPAALPAPSSSESLKEVEIGGQRFISESIDTVTNAETSPKFESPNVAMEIARVPVTTSSFEGSLTKQTLIPVKARKAFIGPMYIPSRFVERPALSPIFLIAESALSLNPDAVSGAVTQRKIASFTAQKPKPIVETLVIARPDVLEDLSIAMRPIGELPADPAMPLLVPFADTIGTLAVSQRVIERPKAPRPVFNFETAVAANMDRIGTLEVSMRRVSEPRLTHAPLPREITVFANADTLGPLSVSARNVERQIVRLPNWFADSTLISNADAIDASTFARQLVAPPLFVKNAAFREAPLAMSPDSIGDSVAMRKVSPMPVPVAYFDAGPVIASNAFVGELNIHTRRFETTAPVPPEFAAVPEIIAAKADVIGSLAVETRAIGPRPNAPLFASLLTSSASPAKQNPVLIDNRVAFARSLIAPMPLRPGESILDVEPMSSKGGPTATIPLTSDKALPTAAANKALPVLIGSKTEFSAELLKPMKPVVVVSNPLGLPLSPAKATAQQQQGYCDPNFVGDPIRFSQTVELKLEDLLNQLHARFGVNFIMGPNVGKFPINVKAGSIPWNVLLRSQLFISGVRARCIDSNTIELIENSLLPNLQDSAGVETKFVKLKFLQRTTGGTVDLANRSQGGQNGGQGGCGGGVGGGQGGGGGEIAGGGGGGGGRSGQTAAMQGSNRFDQLIREIEKILGLRSLTEGSSGGGGAEGSEERRTDRFVTQIPGRNILAIRATEDEHALIAQIIERADRPPFQVVIKGLVYSANQDRIRDIGVNMTASNTGGRTQGGIFGDTLGVGTLFDFSTIIGTFDFNIQATAFQQNGVISVKSRPFATVLDGLCTTLSVGTKLPIVIDSTLGGAGGITILNADNLLAVTPYVVDDENGNPIAVTLDLNLQANVIDSSITARGVPAVNSKNIQTQLLLGTDKTAILGGFSIDQDSKTVTKVPGLGDIPILGELFKRRIHDQRLSRLYFAISAEVIPYPKAIEPVKVPGATTDPQTITEEMRKRAEAGEQKPANPNVPYKKKDN